MVADVTDGRVEPTSDAGRKTPHQASDDACKQFTADPGRDAFVDGRRDIPSLHGLVEQRVRSSPDAVAVADPRSRLTYRELDDRAARLAAWLREQGVGRDDPVGVLMEHRVEYVVACLAALKAGAAFTVLELAYPPALLAQVLADAAPKVALTSTAVQDRLPASQPRFALNGDWLAACPPEGLPHVVDAGDVRPDDLAFVSYSSGTTGRPKGIANPHRAAVGSYLRRFALHEPVSGDRVACNVFFVWEALRPLLRGATTWVVPDDRGLRPLPRCSTSCSAREITETLMTPTLLEAVLDRGGADLTQRLESLRTLWLNGEVVTRTLAARALCRTAAQRACSNVYSASETHDAAAGDLRDVLVLGGGSACPVGPLLDADHTLCARPRRSTGRGRGVRRAVRGGATGSRGGT